MSLRTIPGAPSDRLQARVHRLTAKAASTFDRNLRAATVDDRTINVYGEIGEAWDYQGNDVGYQMTGTTSVQIANMLSHMGSGPVTLNINSPGGDMFEGLAIYNLLREHQGEVIVNVIGTAASAASVIAMAADTLNIGKAAFLMIHNTWTVAAGNRNDFQELAAKLLPFDTAMAAIYSDRTGKSAESVLALMDAETWIDGAMAVAEGFADALLADGHATKETPKASTRKPNPDHNPALPADAALQLTAALAALNLRA